jgi:uncharacterized protein
VSARGSLLALAALVASACAAPAAAQLPPGAPPMATYRFGLLSRGDAWTPERNAHTDSIQAGHLANIKRMWEAGKLVCAGPFLDGGDLRGLFVFTADSLAECRALAAADPAIAAGRLKLELWDWFAPAGIGERYRELARQPGHRDSMVQVVFGFFDDAPGRAPEADSPELDRLQMAHVTRIFAALKDGTLLSAGPLDAAGKHRGVLVFGPAITLEAARVWLADDPFVKSHRLVGDLHPWMFADGTFR